MNRRPAALLLVATLAATGLNFGTAPRPASAATLPPGFTDELVAWISAPTALASTPDGRLLITTQPGQLRIVQNGTLLTTPALDLSARLCSNSERGLLGVAVDPQFATNRYIYLYYTFRKTGCDTSTSSVNRVSRFVLGSDNLVASSSEVVLIDNIPSPAGNHNAGDLAFGKDGFLYVTVGDGGCDYAGGGCAGSNDAARDQHVLLGKILRITRDGAIPSGNPFVGTDSARCNVTGRTDAGKKCEETYAWGLRNPFRFAFDPNATLTRFFINDVGQNVWEEIDLGQAGADYGWNVREGHCANGSTTNCGTPPAGMTNPVYDYDHSSGCASITGGAFVPNGIWPAEYDGAYLFADYVCGKVFRLQPNGTGGYARSDFITGLGSSSAVHLAFGPHGADRALYYTSYAGGGQVRRVYHTAANGVPTASLTASPTSGPVPLDVSFDGSGSRDPEGQALTYLWDFGDGATLETTGPTTSHTYSTAGTYTATLRVRDSAGATSSAVSRTIQAGNTAPSATISSPASGSTFRVGQTITLTGSATDAQDGSLAASRLSWEVLRNHGTHTHPWFSGTGNNLTFTAPAPEDLDAVNNSYLTVRLTATDSGGLQTTATRTVQPRTVALRFETRPTGLRVEVNGRSFTAPASVTSWEAWSITISAPTPQGSYNFRRWSDGGARTHTITTPATATTYTARFRR